MTVRPHLPPLSPPSILPCVLQPDGSAISSSPVPHQGAERAIIFPEFLFLQDFGDETEGYAVLQEYLKKSVSAP